VRAHALDSLRLLLLPSRIRKCDAADFLSRYRIDHREPLKIGEPHDDLLGGAVHVRVNAIGRIPALNVSVHAN
jgi:hypothetical protein